MITTGSAPITLAEIAVLDSTVAYREANAAHATAVSTFCSGRNVPPASVRQKELVSRRPLTTSQCHIPSPSLVQAGSSPLDPQPILHPPITLARSCG